MDNVDAWCYSQKGFGSLHRIQSDFSGVMHELGCSPKLMYLQTRLKHLQEDWTINLQSQLLYSIANAAIVINVVRTQVPDQTLTLLSLT